MTEVPEPVFIKTTITRCLTCHRSIPGEVVNVGGEIFMDRHCPEHGYQSVRIGSADHYHLSLGARDDSCNTPNCCSVDGKIIGTLGRNATLPGAPPEVLTACVTLIEIVDSCNMPCPTCFAGAEVAGPDKLQYSPFGDIQQRVQSVIDRIGHIELLQLSGGEPTLHPQFFEFLDWTLAHPNIDAVIINTNGLKLAHKGRFVDQMRKRARHKKLAIYLQFDGLQDEGQVALRGHDYRQHKLQTLKICKQIGLVVHLAMTVTKDNLPYVGDAIKLGLDDTNIRGISLQPVFGSGRGSITPTDVPITVADIVRSALASSNLLVREDFTSLPCGDPNCHTVAGFVRIRRSIRSVRHFVDFSQIDPILRNKINFTEEDLTQCGCEGNSFAQALQNLLVKSAAGFLIAIIPFMDARTWDQDRIDRCCKKVVDRNNRIRSFCEYYSGFPVEVPGRRMLTVVNS